MAAPATFTAYANIAATAAALSESDTVVVNGEERSSMTDLRTVLFPTKFYVPPSGDVTGATDWVNITAAIAAATAASATTYACEVVLSGRYYVNAPLVIGSVATADNLVIGCNLRGDPHASIWYKGVLAADSYLLTLAGFNYFPSTRLANLHLICDAKIRGLYVRQQSYKCTIQSIDVYNTVKVGVDWLDCWGATCNNLVVRYCTGFALRVTYSQTCVFNSLYFAHCGGTSFPSATESVIFNYAGTAVRTPEANRAALVVSGGQIEFRGLHAEACEITLPFACTNVGYGVQFSGNTYFEGMGCTDCYFLAIGGVTTNQVTNSGPVWEHVSKGDATACTSFIRATGHHDSIVVRAIVTNAGETPGFTNIIVCDAGHLYRPKVELSRVAVAKANQIVAINGGVIDPNAPYLYDFDADESTAKQYTINVGAKLGAGAGWTLGGGAVNLGLMATMAASQTAGTLVVPIPGLKVGDTITGFSVVGQIESAGGAVTLDADLRKLTAAAADVTDGSVGAIAQIAVTADTAVATAKTGLAEVVAATETFYVLLTGTTAASTDIALQGITVTVTEA